MIKRYISQIEMDELLRKGVEYFNKNYFMKLMNFGKKFGIRVKEMKKLFSGVNFVGGCWCSLSETT